jgi:hypothetical protein
VTKGRGTVTLPVERKRLKGIGTSIESRLMMIIKVWQRNHDDNKTIPRLQKKKSERYAGHSFTNPGIGPAPSAPLSGVHLP